MRSAGLWSPYCQARREGCTTLKGILTVSLTRRVLPRVVGGVTGQQDVPRHSLRGEVSRLELEAALLVPPGPETEGQVGDGVGGPGSVGGVVRI